MLSNLTEPDPQEYMIQCHILNLEWSTLKQVQQDFQDLYQERNGFYEDEKKGKANPKAWQHSV